MNRHVEEADETERRASLFHIRTGIMKSRPQCRYFIQAQKTLPKKPFAFA
ncbi:hypothetical protein HMPREF1981_03096 [Bacteroides pyogenes F0041]|uniref:Uncharacterized protein n=1 Tax=Bacteroides pyogenes F0041 TaxID=1321819 RepID=U2DPB3_9BACE|nr:hypothetical protein HMPREF1981_03096 [Bacteroides pyogenes F0041]